MPEIELPEKIPVPNPLHMQANARAAFEQLSHDRGQQYAEHLTLAAIALHMVGAFLSRVADRISEDEFDLIRVGMAHLGYFAGANGYDCRDIIAIIEAVERDQAFEKAEFVKSREMPQ